MMIFYRYNDSEQYFVLHNVTDLRFTENSTIVVLEDGVVSLQRHDVKLVVSCEDPCIRETVDTLGIGTVLGVESDARARIL